MIGSVECRRITSGTASQNDKLTAFVGHDCVLFCLSLKDGRTLVSGSAEKSTRIRRGQNSSKKFERLPASFTTIREGETLVVAEVFYDYEPLFMDYVFEPQVIEHQSFRRPRQR